MSQTLGVSQALDQCWVNVSGVGPTFYQHYRADLPGGMYLWGRGMLRSRNLCVVMTPRPPASRTLCSISHAHQTRDVHPLLV